LRRTSAQLSWHDPKVSQLEAALSRADRRIGGAILKAWQAGCKFDAWREHFRFDAWTDAFRAIGIEMSDYARRSISMEAALPWAHVDGGVIRGFLNREHSMMLESRETPDCRNGPCHTCGLQRWQKSCQDKLSKASGEAASS